MRDFQPLVTKYAQLVGENNRQQFVQDLRELAREPAIDRKPIAIEMRSLLSGLAPAVQAVIVYNDWTREMITQWTPAEAYMHALGVLRSIESANSDAFLVSWLSQKTGEPIATTGDALRAFRLWRKQQLPPAAAAQPKQV